MKFINISVFLVAFFAASAVQAITPSLTTPSLAPDFAALPVAKPKTYTPVAFKPPAVLRRLTKLQQAHRTPDGRYGYVLMDAKTGEVLMGRNEDALFIPASLAKIPTALAALEGLGGELRLKTRLLADGTVSDGTLNGDLHLVGSGDPSLKTRDLKSLAAALADGGIRKIAGTFYYHASAIPQTSVINRHQPRGVHYNTAVGGLNLDLNLRTGRVAVSKPALYTARALRRAAKAKGIALPAPKRGMTAPKGLPIASHESASLSEIATAMMAKSNNMTAEALGSLAAASLGGKPKSLSDAANRTSRWIIAASGPLGGAGWEGFRLDNHSGLSTRSRATPRQMAAILRLGYTRFGGDFVKLHRKEQGGASKGYVIRAKIGTMRFVRGLGGFVRIGDRDLIFAIMSNDDRRRAAADAGRSGLGNAAWTRKARRLEQALLGDWLATYWPRVAGI